MISSARLGAGLFCVLLSLPGNRAFAQDSEASHYAEQGQAALAAGHLEEAQRDFEKLRTLEPGIAEVHAILGRIYFERRSFSFAVDELRIALKLKPTLPKARTLLAVSLSEMTEYREALPDLENCFREPDPEQKQMCGLQLERAYTGLKIESKAVQVALEMDRLYPDNPEVLYNSAKIYGNMAFQAIHRMAVVAPNSPWKYLSGAEVNESQGDSTAAIDQYRQVLVLDPGRPGVHYRIGRTLLAQGRRTGAKDQSDALREFLAELQIDPANANAAYEAGEIYRNSGDFPSAQRYFEDAVRVYPGFEDAHIGLATVFLSRDKPDLALPELRRAIALDPANEVAWYRLSQAARAGGDAAEQKRALAEFQKLHQVETKKFESAPVSDQGEITRQTIDLNVAP